MKKQFAALVFFFTVAAHAAVTVTVNGSNHTIPQTNEKGWGANVTAWIQAISQYTLQPSGGTFTLTADTDFGANYGLKSTYYKSRAANLSSAGILRMGNAESIGWRNAANSGNLLLTVNASDQLTYNGTVLATSTGASFQDSTFSLFDNGDATKLLQFQLSGIATGTTRTITLPNADVNLGALTNANIDAAAGIADTKLATISTSGKVSNSATTATSNNTSSAIVARDGSGNFSAGTITAALSGNATTATALAANGANCSSGQLPLGIDASGAAESCTATPTLGASASATGKLNLSGTTSGTITIQPQDAAGTYNFNLPTTAGSSGQVLTSAGGGSSAMTWTSPLTNPMDGAGQLIYGGAAGVATKLAAGTSGNFLKSAGASAPTWTNLAASDLPAVVSAKFYRSSTASNTAANPINFDTSIEDTNSAVTTGASWKFTVPSGLGGLYQVSFYIVGASGSYIALYKNGAIAQVLAYIVTDGISVGVGTIRLAATDYIDLRNTSTVSISGNATASNSSASHIEIVRLGN